MLLCYTIFTETQYFFILKINFEFLTEYIQKIKTKKNYIEDK